MTPQTPLLNHPRLAENSLTGNRRYTMVAVVASDAELVHALEDPIARVFVGKSA